MENNQVNFSLILQTTNIHSNSLKCQIVSDLLHMRRQFLRPFVCLNMRNLICIFYPPTYTEMLTVKHFLDFFCAGFAPYAVSALFHKDQNEQNILHNVRQVQYMKVHHSVLILNAGGLFRTTILYNMLLYFQ